MISLPRYDLTPTMREINKKFSVRYYLNLVLVDEEDRRYFKQQAGCLLTYSPNMYLLYMRFVVGITWFQLLLPWRMVLCGISSMGLPHLFEIGKK
jgi:hypothetical protein